MEKKLEITTDSGVEMSEESGQNFESGEMKSPREKNDNGELEINEEQIRNCEKTPEQNEKQIDHSIFNTISKIVNPAAKVNFKRYNSYIIVYC